MESLSSNPENRTGRRFLLSSVVGVVLTEGIFLISAPLIVKVIGEESGVLWFFLIGIGFIGGFIGGGVATKIYYRKRRTGYLVATGVLFLGLFSALLAPATGDKPFSNLRKDLHVPILYKTVLPFIQCAGVLFGTEIIRRRKALSG